MSYPLAAASGTGKTRQTAILTPATLHPSPPSPLVQQGQVRAASAARTAVTPADRQAARATRFRSTKVNRGN
ncbi:Hypothetical predicted protein [Pelobates cultripes]|uniref:Uncharacterized protein n=1 Tax=Pelobates cultripes TaxID=61616 RepID=A0AAD1WDW0_PELCU|nr:Hypothetical predicted protein [Pelobates cultripes]